MAAVEELLGELFSHSHPYINELLQHGTLLAGKRMRPALVLLAAKASGQVRQEHIVLAAAIEMIHTASLVHDDVLDEAETRRHVPTIHCRWNRESSVLFGDYLLAKAFEIVGCRVGGRACGELASITTKVCEGELRQIASRGNFELSQDEYFAIIGGKTASLCACATRLGAYYAVATPENLAGTAKLTSQQQDLVDAMHGYGQNLGLAFQIADDVLDLDGDEEVTGKTTGRDLEMAKATLPLLLALEQAAVEERTSILEQLANQTFSPSEIRQWVRAKGGVERAQLVAGDHAEQAAQLVRKFAGDSDASNTLQQLCHFVTHRRH